MASKLTSPDLPDFLSKNSNFEWPGLWEAYIPLQFTTNRINIFALLN